jgi:import receptor subunit TOM20
MAPYYLLQNVLLEISFSQYYFGARRCFEPPSIILKLTIIAVPKPVLDILAEMIAADSDLNVGPFGAGGPGSDRGLD